MVQTGFHIRLNSDSLRHSQELFSVALDKFLMIWGLCYSDRPDQGSPQG